MCEYVYMCESVRIMYNLYIIIQTCILNTYNFTHTLSCKYKYTHECTYTHAHSCIHTHTDNVIHSRYIHTYMKICIQITHLYMCIGVVQKGKVAIFLTITISVCSKEINKISCKVSDFWDDVQGCRMTSVVLHRDVLFI